MKDIALMTAGIIFLLVSLLHLVRLLLKIEIKVKNFILPMWISVFGVIFAGALGAWMFYCVRPCS